MPRSDLIRCFIALYPDADALPSIESYLECLSKKDLPLRMEKIGHVHMTVRFLGDTPSATIDAIHRELEERLADQPVIEAVLDRVGVFPNARAPRVVWIGFSLGFDSFHSLHLIVEGTCRAHGIEADTKKFTPHLTVARVKDAGRWPYLEKEIESSSFQATPVQFRALHMMESALTPKGAIHRERSRVSFRTLH